MCSSDLTLQVTLCDSRSASMLPAISRQSTMQRLSQRLLTFAGMLLSALLLLAGLGTRDAASDTCFAVYGDTAPIDLFHRAPPVHLPGPAHGLAPGR